MISNQFLIFFCPAKPQQAYGKDGSKGVSSGDKNESRGDIFVIVIINNEVMLEMKQSV